MIREDQRISNNNILSSPSCEDNDLSDVVRRQSLDALVHGISLLLIATETDEGELLQNKIQSA